MAMVCYPAAGGLALIVIVSVVETGLGLLSHCQGRTGSVIPLPKQGWVCYPTAGKFGVARE